MHIHWYTSSANFIAGNLVERPKRLLKVVFIYMHYIISLSTRSNQKTCLLDVKGKILFWHLLSLMPINYEAFGVHVEKANISIYSAYAIINIQVLPRDGISAKMYYLEDIVITGKGLQICFALLHDLLQNIFFL